MGHQWMAAATATLLFLGGNCRAAEPINLKLLYAGKPGSKRAKDFVSFLEKYFVKVGSTDFARFREKEADGYDVVLFDWKSIYVRNQSGPSNRVVMPPALRLSARFDKSTILIGAGGGKVAQSRQLKINWL